ncbi:MAG: TrmH family RNA methyltransferase [Bacteroidota bacterium]
MRKLQNSELNRLSVEDFKNTKKNTFSIVLDNVRSLHNVGAAFRTADAFLAEKVYLCGITGKPPHKDIRKTALGATESVAWEYVEHTTSLVKQLKNEGYLIVCIEQVEGSISLANFAPDSTQKYAFVFGNEVFGVEEEVVAMADGCVEIPQFGTKHSLNISVSVGIICWDFLSKTSLRASEKLT